MNHELLCHTDVAVVSPTCVFGTERSQLRAIAGIYQIYFKTENNGLRHAPVSYPVLFVGVYACVELTRNDCLGSIKSSVKSSSNCMRMICTAHQYRTTKEVYLGG